MVGYEFEMLASFHEVFRHRGGHLVDNATHVLETAFRKYNMGVKVAAGPIRVTFITIPYRLPHHSVWSFCNTLHFGNSGRFCVKSLLAKRLWINRQEFQSFGTASA
jgi:hypothetical protein